LHKRKVTGLNEGAIEALLFYSWPGNIRELENIIERGVILAPEGGGIDVAHLFTSGEKLSRGPLKLGENGILNGESANSTLTGQLPGLLRESLMRGDISMDALEEMAVDVAVDIANGNVSAAAKILGTTRSRVAYRLSGNKVPHPPDHST
jgi:DNA-binding NtrC family response regulator